MPQLTPLETQLKNVLSERFMGVDELQSVIKPIKKSDRVITQINFYFTETIYTAIVFVGHKGNNYIRYAELHSPGEPVTLTYKF